MTPPESAPPSERSFLLQWVGYALALIGFTAFTTYTLLEERKAIDHQTRTDLLARSRIVDENVGRQLRAINSMLATIRDRLPEVQRQKNGLLSLNRELENFETAMPSIRTLFVMDAEGTIIAASRAELMGGKFPQRDYFQRVKKAPKRETLFVGQPFYGQLGAFVLNVARMVPAADGSFAGIVGATLDPDDFRILLDSVRSSADATSSLLHGEGKVYLTMPPRQGAEGMDVARPETFFARHMQEGQLTSVMIGTGLMAPNNRMVAMRNIAPAGVLLDKPLVAASGRDLDPVFAQWHEDLIEMIAAGCSLALFGGGFLVISQRRYRQFLVDRNLIAEKEATLRNYIDNAPEGIFVADAKGFYLDVNPAACAEVGYTREELLSMNIADLAPPGTLPEHMNLYEEVKRAGTLNFEVSLRRKDGSLFPANLKAVVLPGQRVMGFCSDISAQKEREARLKFVAHYDPLTSLPNRVLLNDRLQQGMAHADRRNLKLAVVFLDLDRFKEINDAHGHETGDIFLNAMARRMKSALREGDTIARLGGDEFIAVLTDLPDVATSDILVNRLITAIDQDIIIDTLRLRVTASIGITFYPQDAAVDADQLLRQADHAMYQAKQTGKNRYIIHSPD